MSDITKDCRSGVQNKNPFVGCICHLADTGVVSTLLEDISRFADVITKRQMG